MLYYDFICTSCGHEFTDSAPYTPDYETKYPCPHECEGNTAIRLPSGFGGYSGNTGGSSTRPKNSGSFNGKKQKKKINKDGQLEFDFGDE